MLILNPGKPFYVNNKDKIVRMGNFKETGKEIEYDNDDFLYLIENLERPIERKKLLEIVSKKAKISTLEVDSIIKYLEEENFIIEYEKYLNILDQKYDRQDLFFSLFNDNYKNNITYFSDKKILVLGLGGIGSNVVLMLHRCGFNNFILIDNDVVEENNLIRQYPYDSFDIGNYKTDVMSKKINANIKKINVFIEKEEDVENYVKECDIVICTIDKPMRIIRRLINKICINNNKPVIFAGFSEHVAMVGPFVIPNKTACLRCNEKDLDDLPLYNVKIVPSFGPICTFISSIVTNEIVKYFNNYFEYNLQGKTLMFNFADYSINIINWEKNKDCEVCNI